MGLVFWGQYQAVKMINRSPLKAGLITYDTQALKPQEEDVRRPCNQCQRVHGILSGPYVGEIPVLIHGSLHNPSS